MMMVMMMMMMMMTIAIGRKRINRTAGFLGSAWNFHGLIRRRVILETGSPIFSTLFGLLFPTCH